MSDLDSLIAAGLRFAERPESWVAVQGEQFYKIPRRGNSPEFDLGNSASLEIAESEFRDAKYLAGMGANVLEPLALDRACLIYPAISGPDLRDALLGNNVEFGQSGLFQAMRMLGQLHLSARVNAVDRVEYGVNSPFFLTPSDACAQLIQDTEKSIVIDGFEVRNFRYDSVQRTWRFFDPHRVQIGPAECDVARFLVSLLMLRWGRSMSCWIWTQFDPKELVRNYEEASGRELNRDLLRFFLAENVAMREFYACKSIERMSNLSKPLALAYKRLFFLQIRNWVRKYEL